MSEVERYYDEKSHTYDADHDVLYYKVYDTVTWKYLEPYVPRSSDALVLDAGGGTGRWAIRMAKRGCKVILLDILERMLKVAKNKIEAESLYDRVIIKKGDITKLDYPDEIFDLILCEHTLFLFAYPEIVISELVRVLKRNCPLIVTAQNKYVAALIYVPDVPGKGADLLSGRYYFTLMLKGVAGPKVHLMTPNEFRELLEKSGLKVEKIIAKVVTMPLRVPPDIYFKKEFPQDFFDKILQIELALCKQSDALGLAGHLQAIAYKM